MAVLPNPDNAGGKFYTYAPGKAPAGKKVNEIKQAAGEHLAYAPGKGYYVKAGASPTDGVGGGQPYTTDPYQTPHTAGGSGSVPYKPAPGVGATTAPRPPVDPYGALPQDQIDARAGELAQAGLTPQQQEIRRQQDVAARAAAADEAAIQGFQTAAGGLLQGIAPAVGQGYRDAATVQGQIGEGVAGQVGADLTAQQQADQEFAASQGQTGGHTVDPTAVQGTLGYLGASLPSSSLLQQGAAAQAEAARAVQIPLDAGREQIDARIAQARQDNDGYAHQLLDLAAQYPGLKAQALQQLNQYEIDKANYRDAHATTVANIANAKADNARQNKALAANIKAAGLAGKVKASTDAYKWASLSFQTSKAQASAKAAGAKLAAQGRQIDAAASKVIGHVVDKQGRPVLDSNGHTIPVKPSAAATSATGKAKAAKVKATSTARKTGYDYATKLRGKPSVNKQQGVLGGPGKYIAAPGSPLHGPGAVFPPVGKNGVATTNNPNRAARDGAGAANYQDAQTKVWAEIDGDGLMTNYGYSREEVLGIVNRALDAAGWRKK